MKLAASYAVIIVLMLAVVGVGVTKMSALNEAITEVIAGPSKRLEIALRVNERMNKTLRFEKNMALTEDEGLTQKFDAEDMKARNEVRELIATGINIATAEGKPRWMQVQSLFDQYVPINDQVRRLALANKNAEAGQVSVTKSREVAGAMSQQLDQIVGIAQDGMKQADADTNEQYSNARNILFITAGLALLVAIAGAFWISRIVSQGLNKVSVAIDAVAIGDLSQDVTVTSNDEIKDLVETVNRMTANLRQSAELADTIASGDLTVDHQPLSDKDTLGHALVAMVERLRGVVGDATQAAQNVAAGSQQLSSSSEQVSQGATEQAAAAEEASASMEQMAANIKQNADNATQTEKIARQSSQDAEISGQAVQKAVIAMRTIAE
ncbi:HAMP domain-containing protein, partial [Sphingomonas sanguinis]